MKHLPVATSSACPVWRRLAVAACAATLPAIPVAVQAADCQLICLDASCEVRYAGGSSEVPQPPKPGVWQRFKTCEALVSVRGRLDVRYFHQREWFSPTGSLAGIGALKRLFDRYPADDPSLPSSEYVQQVADAMKLERGAHRMDGRQVQPGGHGRPCALGLPCGRLVPPPADWRFSLNDTAFSGHWQVHLARGTPPAGRPDRLDVPVIRGRVQADGRWFQPGHMYAYRLIERTGTVVADGEFSLLSDSMAQRLEGFVDDRVRKGTPPAVARIDALVDNKLLWDAVQTLASEGEVR